jgi:hypothetical protein
MARGFRFEFDPENRILLMRFEDKRLTEESLAEVYAAVRQYSIETNAYATIADFSAAVQVDLSEVFIRRLAREEPAMPRARDRGRIVVISDDAGFAIARMFQMFGESTRPLFHIVRTLDEALEAFGVDSSRFELLP